MIGFSNGEYVSIDEMNVPITSLSINRGYGAFDFFEVIRSKVFYGERHFERFSNSLRALRISTSFEKEIPEIVNSILEQNKIQDGFISMFCLPHTEGDLNPYPGHLYIFPSIRRPIDKNEFENGASLLLKNYQRDIPEAKSTSYLYGQFMRNECEHINALDVLYHNGETVQETSRGNLFLIKNNEAFTPDHGVLKGITRSIVLDILTDKGIAFKERDISLNELWKADEVFVTSTTKLVMPIVAIDGKTIGNANPGKLTKSLLEAFLEIKKNY